MLQGTLLVLAIAACALGASLPVHRSPHTGPARHFAYTKGRIFGGHDAAKGQFPYIVSLQLVMSGSRFHNCGGSIIANNIVLTAGHCAMDPPDYYYAVAGEYDRSIDEGSEQEVLVVEQIVHPDFDISQGVGPYDIAIFKLETELSMNEYVQVISLPSAGSIPEGGSTGVLSGWGYTETTDSPDILQTVDVTVYDYQTCHDHIDDLETGMNPLTETMVCTGPFYEGISICGGDSGGPLEQNGALIGIVSFTMNPCAAPGAPSIFTRVSAYIDFINENL